MVAAFILSLFGLVGFIASMCIIVRHYWRKPAVEAPLHDGMYHLHFVGHNDQTGAAVYDIIASDEDSDNGGNGHEFVEPADAPSTDRLAL
jgi:hypothetical protein